MNTAIRDSVIDTIVKPISRSLQRGFHRAHARLEMANDILDHDHSIVHHEADRDRQCHQGKVVETVAKLVEHREGADQRQRYRDRRDDGGPEISQEDEDHHHDERDRQQQSELHVRHRGADGLGTVRNRVDLDGRRQGRL